MRFHSFLLYLIALGLSFNGYMVVYRWSASFYRYNRWNLRQDQQVYSRKKSLFFCFGTQRIHASSDRGGEGGRLCGEPHRGGAVYARRQTSASSWVRSAVFRATRLLRGDWCGWLQQCAQVGGAFAEEAIRYVCPHTPCSCARTHTDVVSCWQDSSRVGTVSKRVQKSRRSGVNRSLAVCPTPSMSDAKKLLGFHAPPLLPQTHAHGLQTQRVCVRPTTVI